MGLEDQLEELEVLESIFPDELTRISDAEFRITIKLDLPRDVVEALRDPAAAAAAAAADDDDDAFEPPGMVLTVRYPEDYPDKEPHLALSADAQAPPCPYFNVADDKDALLAGLRDTIDENLGMAMVFALVSVLKDAAEQLVVARHAAVVQAQEDARRAAEREENEKFHGTPVTPETFTKWQTAFLAEMAEKRRRAEEERAAELAKKGGRGAGAGAGGSGGPGARDGQRLTGRQLWERGLAGKVDEDDEAAAAEDGGDDARTVAPAMQKLKLSS